MIHNWFLKKEDDRKLCEFCGTELEYENVVLTSIPPQYPYTCPRCGARYVYREGRRYLWSKYGNKPIVE